MKTEFKMEDSELLEMIDIARAPSIPVMLIGGVSTGNEKQESANNFWKRLGEKYKFKCDTVEAAPNKGYNFFLAEPTIEESKKSKPTENIEVAIGLLAEVLAATDNPKEIKKLLHDFLDGVKLNYGIEA